jgi:hypothetical protein
MSNINYLRTSATAMRYYINEVFNQNNAIQDWLVTIKSWTFLPVTGRTYLQFRKIYEYINCTDFSMKLFWVSGHKIGLWVIH